MPFSTSQHHHPFPHPTHPQSTCILPSFLLAYDLFDHPVSDPSHNNPSHHRNSLRLCKQCFTSSVGGQTTVLFSSPEHPTSSGPIQAWPSWRLACKCFGSIKSTSFEGRRHEKNQKHGHIHRYVIACAYCSWHSGRTDGEHTTVSGVEICSSGTEKSELPLLGCVGDDGRRVRGCGW